MYRANTVTENGIFQKRFSGRKCLKTPFSYAHVDGTFQERLLHGIASRARSKTADGRITFVSLLLGLFSNLIAVFGINLALLKFQADYVRVHKA